MGNKPAKPFLDTDAEKKEDSTSSTEVPFPLARLPKHIRESVGEFFSDVDDVLLKRAGGPQMKNYYTAKVELAACIKQSVNEYNKIPAILE